VEFIVPVLVILGLLFISAFFSGGELALMALDPIALETRARQGSLIAKLQQTMRNRPQRVLSTLLIGYNVANISLTAYVTLLAIHYLAPISGISEERATLISTVCVTVAITLFAELLPKTVAAVDTVKTAKLVTLPIYLLDILLTPINWTIGHIITPLVYLMTGKRQGDMPYGVNRADVLTAISMAHAGGELPYADLRVASEAVRLSTRNLADVMAPRVDLVAVPSDCTVEESLRLMLDSGFSRLPVYKSDLDEIIGVLLMKDLVRSSLQGQAASKAPRSVWTNKPVLSQNIVDSLALMQRERTHMAVVVDEHGGTAGIATLEDILEELVGEIHDESDPVAGMEIVRRGEDHAIVTGRARLDQLPELATAELGEMESTTVGGLVMERLGRSVVVGDSIDVGTARIKVLKMLRTRIKLLRVDYASETLPTEDGPDAAIPSDSAMG
jgi:CBS domain containing-hemolysin-like protein